MLSDGSTINSDHSMCEGPEAFRAAQTLGGLKLSLGGQSYFGQSQLNSVTSSLLYADSVLIPDPILPWLESARQDERFRHVKLLQATFVMLHLRPLVDANLLFPACIVFPSWEKSLEEHDLSTWQRSSQLVADFIAHFVNRSLQSYDDVIDFVDFDPEVFVERAQKHSLFSLRTGKQARRSKLVYNNMKSISKPGVVRNG